MNPDTKIILDELSKRFGEFESKLDSRFSVAEQKLETRLKETESSLESRVAEKEEHLESLFSQADDRWERRFADLHISHEARVEALERAVVNVDIWRPSIEDSLGHIRLEVNKLSKNWERALLDPRVPPVLPTPMRTDPRVPSVFTTPELLDPRAPPTVPIPTLMDPQAPPISPTTAPPPTAVGHPSASSEAARPTGHHDELRFRDQEYGSITTILPDPGKGTFESPTPPTQFHGKRYDSASARSRSGDSTGFGKLPKVSFPIFDGDNPRFWISRCETYFDMYRVDPSDWIRVSSMHLSPSVARWFQAIECKHPKLSWPVLCKLLHERFGKEQHQTLLHQLFRIMQSGTVSDYIDEFTSIVDQLDAYESVSDPLYFTTRFVDGLRDDIRAVVMIQRPSELDSACSLALLQEEVTDPHRHRDTRRLDGVFSTKPPPRIAVPLPAPPRIDKPVSAPATSPKSAKSAADQFASLKAYRRARGLCDKCAEKWHPGHKCASTIQLNVVQELFELFNEDSAQTLEDSAAVSPPIEHFSQDQLFLALSSYAVAGKEGPRTMKLQGIIQNLPMLILVDSGSSHTFISQRLASQLQGVLPMSDQVSVQIANGTILHCSSHIPVGQWSVQGYCFTSNIKVIPLEHFDFILGMDWLESFSPMKVHWKLKWMAILYQGSTVILQGLLPPVPEELLVQVSCISSEEHIFSLQDEIPTEISALLSEFAPIFAPVDGLPPARSCDHSIPLVPGAKPVYIRPYRYPPALKDETEKQIQEMLDKGLIQPSSSPFSSPLLLVRKKDGSWRPCVDYRYLNALTIRGQFPIPIFDELVDELSGAAWFSSLDLNSGFHQIRMKPGEEFKTAFQTKFDHFEFKVMSFGLCGAPASFQGAMNSTLKPLLRKCVLVFFDDILVYSKTFEDHISHL
ncbi:unnamed protein product [Urochloa humidicola]